MGFFARKDTKDLDVTAVVDAVEAYVYERLKPLGFRKFGRTLHRFVSEDISQVVNFQTGLPSMGAGGHMWVNTGIRIPECAERSFSPQMQKKYYHEYECQLRSRLGAVRGKKETCYDLSRDPEKLAGEIWKEIEQYVLPAFDVLCNRRAILEKRRSYPNMDRLESHLICLQECFLYGRMGDLQKARASFLGYYDQAVSQYEERKRSGSRVYLKKGETVMYKNQKITAEKNGYYTVYDANDGHIRYLQALARTLGWEVER